MKIQNTLAALALSFGLPLTAHSQPALTDGTSTMPLLEFKQELLVMPPASREPVLKDRAALGRYAASVMSNLRAEAAARAAGFDKLPDAQAAMRKGQRDALARTYLQALIDTESAKLPDLGKLAEEHYHARIDSYRVPEQVRLAHILLKTDPEDPTKQEADVRLKAEKLLADLKAGADFAEAAKAQSDDKGSGERGGELGWVARGKTAPPFERAGFALKDGEMSDLVRTRFGFHIIKRFAYQPAKVRPFAEVKAQIVKTLTDQRVSQIKNDIVARFNSTQDVEVSEEFAAALRAELAK